MTSPRPVERFPWPQWSRPAVCLATGPSVTAEQVQSVRLAHLRGRVHVLALNDMGLPVRHDQHGIAVPTAPWADLWYAADETFWRTYATQAAQSPAVRASGSPEPVARGTVHLYVMCHVEHSAEALALEPGHVVHGGHGGIQALQLALSLGAPKVLLVGYDARAAGRTNYFGDKPRDLHRASAYGTWVEAYAALKLPADREVVNCTPGSAITAFRSGGLTEELLLCT